MDQVSYILDVENSFFYFLILLQKLHLYEGVMALMLRSDYTILAGFIERNEIYVRKPDGILIL